MFLQIDARWTLFETRDDWNILLIGFGENVTLNRGFRRDDRKYVRITEASTRGL